MNKVCCVEAVVWWCGLSDIMPRPNVPCCGRNPRPPIRSVVRFPIGQHWSEMMPVQRITDEAGLGASHEGVK